MQDGTKAQEVFNEATSKALETMTFWAEANQRDLVGRFRYDVDEIVFVGFGLGERLAGREN